MLQSIRTAADNLFFRIILGAIVVAFGFWGIDDVLRSRNNFDLVTFKNADNISEEEFNHAKGREISIIQRSQGINLSEEQIKQSGINEVVLDRLISNKLIDQLVNEYNLNFGDKTLADFIRQQNSFKDKDGKFDINLFKSILKHSGMSEEEYTQETKNQLVRSVMLSTFMHSSFVSNAAVNNIAEFMSEERTCDIASTDLTNSKKQDFKIPTKDQIEEFYKANAELFTLPEKRSILYLIIDQSIAKKDIKVTEDEIKQYYEDNKEDYAEKPYAKVKSQIESSIIAKKTDEILAGLVKKLEDEVAAGTTLKEIAEKLKLEVVEVSNVTSEDLSANKTIGLLTDNIFTMQKSEVSYPLELQESKAFALLEVTDISKAQLQELDKIKQDVIKKWNLTENNNRNIKIMQDFIASANPDNFKENAKENSLVLNTDVKLKRAEISNNDKLPLDMVTAIFAGGIGLVDRIYVTNDKVFAVIVRSAGHNTELKKKVLKDSGDNIATQIRNSLMQEIMTFIKNKENVQVNTKDRVLE